MDKDNKAIIICMFLGMILGLATGCALGAFQQKIGIFMCYGLVFGLIVVVIVGMAINKYKGEDK